MTFANSTGIMFQSFAHCNNGRAEGIKAMFLQMFNEFGGPLLRDRPEENNEENNDHNGDAGDAQQPGENNDREGNTEENYVAAVFYG